VQWNLDAVKPVDFYADRHSTCGAVCNNADPVSHNLFLTLKFNRALTLQR
jgi:hypothetical protein